MVVRVFSLLLLVMSLVGCETYKIAPETSRPDDANSGIVVVSLTKSGTDPWLVFYKYRQIGGEAEGFFTTYGYEDGVLTSDFSEIPGNLIAKEIPAGEYEISTWYLTRWQKMRESEQPLGLRFRVEPGKITYIGELNLDTGKHDIQEAGNQVVKVSVLGAAERDIRYAQKLYPNIDYRRFKIRMLRLAE